MTLADFLLLFVAIESLTACAVLVFRPSPRPGADKILAVLLFCVALSMPSNSNGLIAPGVAERRSNPENHDLRWLRYWILLLFLVFMILGLSGGAFILAVAGGIAGYGEAAALLITGGFIAALVVLGLRQHDPLAPPFGERSEKYSSSGMDASERARAFEGIKALMEMRKSYPDGDLTLAKLASLSGVPEYRVSQVINQNSKMNFAEFVNVFRVEHAKGLMADPMTDRKLLAVALDAGFNSNSAFNAAFKRLTGSTPSDFKSELT